MLSDAINSFTQSIHEREKHPPPPTMKTRFFSVAFGKRHNGNRTFKNICLGVGQVRVADLV